MRGGGARFRLSNLPGHKDMKPKMKIIKPAFVALMMLFSAQGSFAQTPAAPITAPTAPPVEAKVAPAAVTPPATANAPTANAVDAKAAAPAQPVTTIGTSAPVDGIGQPVAGAITIQPQVTEIGQQALDMHNYILMPVMVVISLFVLGLMFWVVARFRRNANPVPSKTTHNTFIEVVWTLVPVIILVGISIPSIKLLAAQYQPAPANAVTLKAIGNQWYWSYEYPDNGVEVTANMLSDADAKARKEPAQLAVDNRVVLPVNTPIKLLTTANDVIHAWAMPAFWIKMDAVPGRINETSFTITKTGVYYGQCSELCGDRHGYMPIGVEVVSKEDFATWIRAKGGKMPGDEAPAAATPAPAVAPAPTAAATPVPVTPDAAATATPVAAKK
jgi:cytochrome c oxidase subunit II